MPTSTLSIPEIKDTILRRARERQSRIERGELDVPLRHAALPLTELLDCLSQWDYRRDALALAVPPPSAGLAARISRFCKSIVCKSFRWLMIRQVEFNTAGIRHAQVLASLLAAVDRNEAEFLTALTSLKLQVHALGERVGQLQGRQVAGDQGRSELSQDDSTSVDDQGRYEVYRAWLVTGRGEAGRRDPLPVLGCGGGDLLRFLISEGTTAQGVESDPQLVDFCRERELPAICGTAQGYVESLEDDSVAGIVLERKASAIPTRQLASLLGACWKKLEKGGLLIAEAPGETVAAMPLELLALLFESQCFTVVDGYRNHAIVGRK